MRLYKITCNQKFKIHYAELLFVGSSGNSSTYECFLKRTLTISAWLANKLSTLFAI